ncbi:MAG: 2-C-methyl-D-erythritol 2,4-cyclodiphosphate synthase [Planctomycetota bacterium]
MRVGMGYDIHPLVDGETLVLGGVEFPGSRGLEGNSDADVVLHAVTDAILGAAAMGDLGRHFPDDTEEYTGIESALILEEVMEKIENRGFEVHNVDINLIAEYPRLGDRRGEMRGRIAELLHVPVSHVSLKARSAEKMGPVGREEAVEARAVVLLEMT